MSPLSFCLSRNKGNPVPEFVPFPKIPRLRRDCIITEKLDGSNAGIQIVPIGEAEGHDKIISVVDDHAIFAQSRSRFIVPGDDNYGFARWVADNAPELVKLGPGTHFGEWWGQGIQRGYGLKEKRFSLFNVGRWGMDAERAPDCCGVVPLLFEGPFVDDAVEAMLELLKVSGSQAVPGFMKPEGIIVYLPAAKNLYKVLLEKDDIPKGLAA